MIYLDYAATTPVDDRVVEAMVPYFTEIFSNPSSKHTCGRKAASAVENARRKVARILRAQPDEIIFTGGASEANNLAIKGIADQYDAEEASMHFITSSFEHKATLNAMKDIESRGHSVSYIQPGPDGVIDPEDVAEALQDNTALVSIMHVNNEIGTIQPIAEIAALCQGNGCLFHTDATQSFGKMPIDVEAMGIDLLSLSAHKVYGPKGIGALYVNRGIPVQSQISGGSQEEGRRAGTLNVPGIVGLGAAADIARLEMESEWDRLEALELGFLKALRRDVRGVYLQGGHGAKVPWITNVCFEGIEGGELRDQLGDADICVSRSSACSKSNAASHVLEAIDCPSELRGCAIRFSFGRKTTPERLSKAYDILVRTVAEMRQDAADADRVMAMAVAR
jgi:cysteine desulfurase